MTEIFESLTPVRARPPSGHVYVRPPEPIEFPAFESEEERVSESKRHLENRTALYLVLQEAFAATCAVGSDQFVYFDPTNAHRCLSPDAFVKLGRPDDAFPVWKTWERGAPELGVEIISKTDRRDRDWDDKLARYRASGILELVRFDVEDAEPIRVWDHVSGDVVERAAHDPDRRFCHALGLWWVVLEHPQWGPMLRLARDREGRDPLPTPAEGRVLDAIRLGEVQKALLVAEHEKLLAEQAKSAAEQKLREAEQARHDESEARREAESEVERLKEALRRTQGAG